MYRNPQEHSTPHRLSDGWNEPDHWPPEKVAAARTIRRLMEFWQIKPSELSGRKQVESPPPALPAAPKYKHPTSGETWDGQGHQPDWLKNALLKEGYTVEELRLIAD